MVPATSTRVEVNIIKAYSSKKISIQLREEYRKSNNETGNTETIQFEAQALFASLQLSRLQPSEA